MKTELKNHFYSPKNAYQCLHAVDLQRFIRQCHSAEADKFVVIVD